MQKPQIRLKVLRSQLRYWQMMVRMDIKALKASRQNVKDIACQMRQVQAEARSMVRVKQ